MTIKLSIKAKDALVDSLMNVGFFRTDAFRDVFSPWVEYFEDIDEIQQIPEIRPQKPGYSVLIDLYSIPGLHEACAYVANAVTRLLPQGYIFGHAF